MANYIIINQSEKDLIDKIKEQNTDESSIWSVPNLLIPIGAIVLAILANLFFSENRGNIHSYLNLIVNGSLPLIALNQISSVGIVIFDYDKSKEKSLGIGNTVKTRRKLFYWSLLFFVISVVFYCYQVISSPFTNTYLIILIFIASIVIVTLSTKVSKYLFYLQETFINKTFDQEFVEDMKNKKFGQNWK
jgi:hypothetical protein